MIRWINDSIILARDPFLKLREKLFHGMGFSFVRQGLCEGGGRITQETRMNTFTKLFGEEGHERRHAQA